ncbi:hypothetical protein [Sorangium sp. So ce1078]|uniref:hypothetical protein n=1 Tax=Sorangium sp. So ce1078 TaxID=3133329 RepID=UPI003F6366FB
MNTLRHLKGWSLLCASLLLIAVLSLTILWHHDFSVEGVRLVIRMTARTSLLLFLLAFTASAAFRLWPGRWTRWQRANRRYLGLSFAGSHAMHAVAITALARMDPALYHSRVKLATYVLSGLGYVFIIAMASTSFKRTAAWIGPRAWKVLHVTGAYYLWLTFMKAFVTRAPADSFYWPFVGVLAAAMLIRIVGMAKVTTPAHVVAS